MRIRINVRTGRIKTNQSNPFMILERFGCPDTKLSILFIAIITLNCVFSVWPTPKTARTLPAVLTAACLVPRTVSHSQWENRPTPSHHRKENWGVERPSELSKIGQRAPTREQEPRGPGQRTRRIKSSSSPKVWWFGREHKYPVIQASAFPPGGLSADRCSGWRAGTRRLLNA